MTKQSLRLLRGVYPEILPLRFAQGQNDKRRIRNDREGNSDGGAMRGIRFLLVLVLACIVNAGVACAYEFLASSEGNYLRWSADDIPIDYKISNWWLPPGAVEPVGAIYAGFKTWEDVATASVSFNYHGTTTEPSLGELDGVNMIGWNAEAFIGGWETHAFGVCQIMWYDTETFEIEESDIALNIYYPWTTTGEVGKYDIQGIVTHEVGHLLGLGHSDVLTATMIDGPTFYSTHNTGDEILLRTLDPDDIAGIGILYPLDYVTTGPGGAGGGCFIATAVYGSKLAGEVKVLSDFRDRYLIKNEFGRRFVELYYRVSPPVAKFIGMRPILKKLARVQITPFVKVVKIIEERRGVE